MYRDVGYVLKPLQLFANLCGICPYSSSSTEVPTSSTLYTCFLLVYPTMYFVYTFISEFTFFKGIVAFTMCLSRIVTSMNHYVLTGASLFSSQEYAKIYQTIRHAEKILYSENIAQEEVPSRKSQRNWILFTVFLATVVAVSLIYVTDFSFYIITSILILNLCPMAHFHQFRGFLTLLRDKLTVLNWHFDDLNSHVPGFIIPPADLSFKEFFCVSRSRNKMFVQPKLASRIVTPKKIRAFNQIHFLLCSATRQIDSNYNLQNLFNNLNSGFSLITASIYIFSNTKIIHFHFIWRAILYLTSIDILSSTIIMLKLTHEINSQVI